MSLKETGTLQTFLEQDWWPVIVLCLLRMLENLIPSHGGHVADLGPFLGLLDTLPLVKMTLQPHPKHLLRGYWNP